MKTMTIQVRNNQWILAAERAAFWKEEKILLISDPHLGKGAAFRKLGVPVPGGITAADLERLSLLIKRFGPDVLLILGDLMHAAAEKTRQVRELLARWRESFSSLSIVLVQGNHDQKAGGTPDEFRVNHTVQEFEKGPFLFVHARKESLSKYVVAGHTHPCVSLVSPGRMKESFRCFFFSREFALLPAFGSFTGSKAIQPKGGDRIFLVQEDEITRLPKILKEMYENNGKGKKGRSRKKR
jgi:DNA ligase-associated metallophosphoesterase